MRSNKNRFLSNLDGTLLTRKKDNIDKRPIDPHALKRLCVCSPPKKRTLSFFMRAHV